MIKKSLASLAFLALMGLPFACGGRPQSPGLGMCEAVAWGGWDGTPECSGIASIVIAPEFRGCFTDADCALVGTTNCSSHAANQRGAASLAQSPAPCSLPLLGYCQPVRYAPTCQQGCCVPVRL